MSGPPGQLDQLASSSGASAWKPTAPPPGSSIVSEPAAQQSAWGPPWSGDVELLAGVQVEDQERRLAPLGLLGSGDVPAGGHRGVRELVGERGVAGDHDQAVAAARREWLGVGWPVRAGTVTVVVIPAPSLAPESGRRRRSAR